MSKSLKQRRRNMHDLIVNNAGAVKTLFIRYLHQRNYDGKLSFDFDDEKLEIKVM